MTAQAGWILWLVWFCLGSWWDVVGGQWRGAGRRKEDVFFIWGRVGFIPWGFESVGAFGFRGKI